MIFMIHLTFLCVQFCFCPSAFLPLLSLFHLPKDFFSTVFGQIVVKNIQARAINMTVPMTITLLSDC